MTTADQEHTGRSFWQWLLTPLAVLLWLGALVLGLQMIPYTTISGAQRIDTVDFCLRDIAEPSGTCIEAGQTKLPAGIKADGRTLLTYSLSVPIADLSVAQAIFIPRAIDAVHVKMNGAHMNPPRNLDEPVWHDWNQPVYVGLPAPLLRASANTIDIQLRRDGEGRLLLNPFYIGPADLLNFHWLLRFAATSGASRMNWAISVITTLASLSLWRMSRRSMGIGWLTLASAASVIAGTQWAFPNVTPHHPAWAFLCYLSIPGLGYFTFRFLHRFFGDPSGRHLLLMNIFVAANLAILLLSSVGFGILPDAVFFAGLTIMAFLTLDWLLSVPKRNDGRPTLTLFFIFSLSVALGLTQLLDMFGPPGLIRAPLGAPGMSIFFSGVTWSLLQRFIELSRQRERLNTALTEQVAQKTAELQDSYAELVKKERLQTMMQERQRIMLDLHDGIGGHLVNTLAYMENAGHNDPVLQNALEDALRDMALMIDSLSIDEDIPVMLGVIRDRLEPLLARHKARFDWQVDGDTRLDDQTPSNALALMRIVQEAITNAVKHSSATTITVRSEERAVSIHDNGVGFDLSAKSTDIASNRGFGLRGMRQRAADMGITLEIASSTKGTLVDLRW